MNHERDGECDATRHIHAAFMNMAFMPQLSKRTHTQATTQITHDLLIPTWTPLKSLNCLAGWTHARLEHRRHIFASAKAQRTGHARFNNHCANAGWFEDRIVACGYTGKMETMIRVSLHRTAMAQPVQWQLASVSVTCGNAARRAVRTWQSSDQP